MSVKTENEIKADEALEAAQLAVQTAIEQLGDIITKYNYIYNSKYQKLHEQAFQDLLNARERLNE